MFELFCYLYLKKQKEELFMRKIITLLFIFNSISFYGQWIPQNSGINDNLNDVYCVSENYVVAVGDNGRIVKTIDGGFHWILKNSGTTQNLKKVQFVNQDTGYAVGFNGLILKTIDGGENWATISIGNTTNLYGLSVLNTDTYFVAGDNGLIEKTVNGGVSFTMCTFPENQTVSNIQFFSELIGYAQAGVVNPYNQQSNLYKTTDGGITWSLIIAEPIDSFFFLNDTIGFINKTNNGFYKTVDGGLTLTIIGPSKSNEIDIFSLNENVIWDIGNQYTLCNCDSYCVSKREIGLQEIDNCNNANNQGFIYSALFFANETTGYIVGINGSIFKNATGTMQEATASINDFDKNIIHLYPNPTTGIVNFSDAVEINSVDIVDSFGRSVKYFPTVDNNVLDLHELSTGIYFCVIISKEKKITQKLILNK